MSKGPFGSEQFTATHWSSAGEKAQFGNQLLRFIDEGFHKSLFTKTLYNRLSQCFQHIAHHDLQGFYGTWFAAPGDQARFLDHLLRSPCFGDPTYTYSDVERHLQIEIRRRNYVALYRLAALEAERSTEMKLLERLESKYRRPFSPIPQPAGSFAEAAPELMIPSQRSAPVQQMLF